MRSTLSFLALALSLITACSGTSSGTGTSGSSSGARLGGVDKVKTCKNATLNPPNASSDSVCNECEATKCSAEGATALGTDPGAFGGACGDFLVCSCECLNTDSVCLAKCPSPTQACKDALTAAQNCEHTKCAAECTKDAG